MDWEVYSGKYDSSVNHRSGIAAINLPGVSDGQCHAAHGDEEKRLLYPDITSWMRIDSRAEYERRYPHMSDRIIDNLVEPYVGIPVVPWDRINGKTLEFPIEAAFRYRANCPYDLSRPMRKANPSRAGPTGPDGVLGPNRTVGPCPGSPDSPLLKLKWLVADVTRHA